MRKAIIAAFVLIAVSIFLGATVLREPVAQAAKQAQAVLITNNATNPGSVTSSDDPGRMAFTFNEISECPSCQHHTSFQFVVPAGKRLVIESISVLGRMEQGVKLTHVTVLTQVNGEYARYYMAPPSGGALLGGTHDEYVVSQQTTLYADGGTTVLIQGERDGFTLASFSVEVSVQGHLIDCSVAACG